MIIQPQKPGLYGANAVRWALSMQSYLKADALLGVSGAVTLQRSVRTADGLWADDHHLDPTNPPIAVIPIADFQQFAVDNPEIAQKLSCAWSGFNSIISAAPPEHQAALTQLRDGIMQSLTAAGLTQVAEHFADGLDDIVDDINQAKQLV